MFDATEIELAFFIKIELPSHTIRWCEGRAITLNAEQYSPIDSLAGVLNEISSITDGADSSAPSFDMFWTPASNADALSLIDGANQSQPFTMSIASIDRATNTVLTSKEVFQGITDYAVLHGGENKQQVQIGIATNIDRFLMSSRGNSLNDAFLKRVWPGDEGLSNCTGVLVPVPWGNNAPQSSRTGGGGGDVSRRVARQIF